MISVIVPYKDSEQWIGRCCTSLTRQKGDMEFILVDDNSKDNGNAIVKDYAKQDDRFVYVNNKNLPGVSGARNTGLELAAGEWITFLDADDELTKNAWKLFEQATTINAKVIQFNHYRHYERINKTALKYTNTSGCYTVRHLPMLWCMVWNKLYKADVVRNIRFIESMQFGEDEIFNLECVAIDGGMYCADGATSVHHFDNKQSLAKTKTESDLFKQAEELMNFIKRHDDPALRQTVCGILSEHWQSRNYMVLVGHQERME